MTESCWPGALFWSSWSCKFLLDAVHLVTFSNNYLIVDIFRKETPGIAVVYEVLARECELKDWNKKYSFPVADFDRLFGKF